MMTFSHRNGETDLPTEVGHYWFRGMAGDEPYAGQATILQFVVVDAYEKRLGVIGVEATSILSRFKGQWWGPEDETPPWEMPETVTWTPMTKGITVEGRIGDAQLIIANRIGTHNPSIVHVYKRHLGQYTWVGLLELPNNVRICQADDGN